MSIKLESCEFKGENPPDVNPKSLVTKTSISESFYLAFFSWPANPVGEYGSDLASQQKKCEALRKLRFSFLKIYVEVGGGIWFKGMDVIDVSNREWVDTSSGCGKDEVISGKSAPTVTMRLSEENMKLNYYIEKVEIEKFVTYKSKPTCFNAWTIYCTLKSYYECQSKNRMI